MKTKRASIFIFAFLVLVFVLGYQLGMKKAYASTIETPTIVEGDGEGPFRRKIKILLDSVQKYSGRDDLKIQVYTSGRIDLAAAEYDEEYDERQITFNQKDLAKVRKNTNKYAPLLIGAHEFAHHFFMHDFTIGDCNGISESEQFQRQDEEREADYYAGYVLGLEGTSTLEDLNIVMRHVDSNFLVDDCYPPFKERLSAIKEGFRKGRNVLVKSPLKRTPQWDEMLSQYLEFNALFNQNDSSLLITTGLKAQVKKEDRVINYDSLWLVSSNYDMQAITKSLVDSLQELKPYLNAEDFVQPEFLKAINVSSGFDQIFVFENHLLLYEHNRLELFRKANVIYKIDSLQGITPFGSLEKSAAFRYGFPYVMKLPFIPPLIKESPIDSLSSLDSLPAIDSVIEASIAINLDSITYLIDEDGIVWEKAIELMAFPKPSGLILDLE